MPLRQCVLLRHRDHARRRHYPRRDRQRPGAPRTGGRYRGDPSRIGVHRLPELDSSRTHRSLHLVLGRAAPGLHAIVGSGTVENPSLTSIASFFPNRRAPRRSVRSVSGSRAPSSRRTGTKPAPPRGTTCQVQEPEFAIDVPSWWEPLTLPIWRPDLADTTILRDAIAGHVSVQGDVPGSEPVSQNTLVYFADWRVGEAAGCPE